MGWWVLVVQTFDSDQLLAQGRNKTEKEKNKNQGKEKHIPRQIRLV
jgi:hypothetical protein